MLIDCHSHLANYNEDEIAGIISRSQKSGVSYIFSAGTDIENSKKTIDLANSNDAIYCVVGIHPNRVTEYIQDIDFYKLEQLANSSSKVITMSEMGMDYMPNAPQRKIQENVFIAQITIAKKLKSRRLLLITDVEGVLDQNKKLISEITPNTAKKMMSEDIITGGMIPKMEACIEALAGGAISQIIDGRVPGALKDVVLGRNLGTRIG